DKYRRYMPGRIIGASVDAHGNKALRLSLQTREQHIRREKATSNICTAQALLASMAAMYAVYHGAEGLRKIASNIHYYTGLLNEGLKSLGYNQENTDFFDTLKINLPSNLNASDIRRIAEDRKQNYYYIDYKTVEISLDETDTLKDVNAILKVFSLAKNKKVLKYSKLPEKEYFDARFSRKSQYLAQPEFKQYHGELEMMRYLKRLEHKDFSLTEGMIPLGSCTMKLTGAMEIFALTWPEFGKIHPFAPDDQTKGFQQLIWELEQDLKSITGFDAFTFQPNSGAAGEYTGMMIIRKYHQTRGDMQRNVILIPSSAHGTNPASAAMAGMKVVVVDCDERGNIDVEKLRQLATANKKELAGFMITYPSTHGVFEASIKEMVDIIHQNGGLVYMDGA
ncbi:MAG: aminotransferase class V-fold PLP-dependent enzyme, partial [Bacteroidota bacterium]|nr:aminotransferase class V-fold PLP-dependent enzyme [Bacteroidota bacterium]